MMDNTPTDNTLEQIARMFCPLPASNVQLQALGSGNINDTYLVHCPDRPGAFVLQRINQHVFKQPWEVIENSRKLFEHLVQKALPLRLLEPVRTRDGAYFTLDERVEPSHWRAFDYITPSVSYDYASTAALAFHAGEAMAVFLAGLSDLDTKEIYSVIPHFHDSSWRLVHFKEALEADAANRVRECGLEIDFVLRESSVFRQVDEAGFPQRIVHNDAKIANMLFDPTSGKALAVIDWDTAMPGAVPSDFGDMVRTMTTTLSEDDTRFEEVHLRLEWFEALVRGFIPPLKHVITKAELQALVLGAKWIILEQMMRFLGDFIQGDTYYKTLYPDHNLVRTRNQMALYRSLLHQEHLLQRAVNEVLA